MSGASHCGSDKSVGDLDAAESLIVLSSTNGQDEKCHSKSDPADTIKNNLSSQSKDSHNTIGQIKGYSGNSNAKYIVNGNPMDLSPANIPILATKPMHIEMQNHTLQPVVTSITAPSNLTISHCGTKHYSSLTGPNQSIQQHHHNPHRQIMTVNGPVTDHVALVDTVLNQPSAPTMVIPMDESDQHKIHRLNPNNVLYPNGSFNGGSLVSGER